MDILPISPAGLTAPSAGSPSHGASAVGGTTFGDTLRGFVSDVNAQQVEAGDMVNKLVSGQPVELHDVMIAGEKAKTSFDLLLELRNKAIDMYREVMRLQV